MLKHLIYLFLIPVFILSSCSKEEGENEIVPLPSITDFAFLVSHNPGLSSNIYTQILGNTITGNLPYDAKLDNLIATFNISGVSVSVDNKIQESGVTTNDFTKQLTYTITAADGIEVKYEVKAILFNGLPIFFINTNNNIPIDSKEEYVEGDFFFYGNHESDDLESDMKIRGRGNSTWYIHPKKPYQMKLGEKTALMGMPEDKKWVFLAEHSDKTFLRNKVAFELGYLSNLEWTPQSSFADVFVNDEYDGTYHITQKVEESKNRVNLEDNGYLLEIDQLERLDPDDVYFYSSKFLINIKEPDLTYESAEYFHITNYIAEFETALYGNNFTNPDIGYQKYIDIDSFVDWYLINEISKNQDARDWSSIFMNLVVGEKLKMGPVWDFDLAFGNVNYSDCEFPEGYWVKYHSWIERMFEDPLFVSKVKVRFSYFKSHESDIYEAINVNAEKLRYSANKNNEKWDVLGNWIWPNAQVFDTYQQEVDYLKEWISKRMIWLNNEFSSL